MVELPTGNGNSHWCDVGTPGHYPAAVEGVAAMTVCFNAGNQNGGQACDRWVAVGVVRCEDFLLWRLPYAPQYESGYCTVPSGL